MTGAPLVPHQSVLVTKHGLLLGGAGASFNQT
jgi:hypothetical protein